MVFVTEPLSEARTQLADFFNSLLSQLRQAVDDSEPDFIADLHLHHFGDQAGAHMLGILKLELDLSPAALDQVKQQHRGQPLEFVISGVLAHVEDLGHARSLFG
jgi:hypothetical protein